MYGIRQRIPDASAAILKYLNSNFLLRGALLHGLSSHASFTRRKSSRGSSPQISHGPASKTQNLVSDIRHYLRLTEVLPKLRDKLLRTKLQELADIHLSGPAPANKQQAKLASLVHDAISDVLQHYESTLGPSGGLLDYELQDLFDRFVEHYSQPPNSSPGKPSSAQGSAAAVREHPLFVARLAQRFLMAPEKLQASTLTNIVFVGASARASLLSTSLALVLQATGHNLPVGFQDAFFERVRALGQLSPDIFDTFVDAASAAPAQRLVDEATVFAFTDYLDLRFAEENPRVHEYIDENRNLLRLQELANKLTKAHLRGASASARLVLRLLKYKTELNTVLANSEDLDTIESLVMHLQAHGEDSGYSELKVALDSDMALVLVTELARAKLPWAAEMYLYVAQTYPELDAGLRAQTLLYLDRQATPLEPSAQAVQDLDSGDFLENTSELITCLMLSPLADRLAQADALPKDNVYDYVALINGCIDLGDPDKAYAYFEESLAHEWDGPDPALSATLDRLVIALAQKHTDIRTIFPMYKRLKQHMTQSLSASGLQVMVQRMLEGDCLGDVLEIMKRELPDIKRDLPLKLRTDTSWSAPYRALFDTVHGFVLQSSQDPTYEANWVMYGDLHKYFHFPPELYLPALQFFCLVDRLNAALLIVRRMKMLSDLHMRLGLHPPPTRDIYMFLLDVFGNRLYEEGVVEVHEYLNLDVKLESPDAALHNCILNAYSNLQSIGKVRDLFLAGDVVDAQTVQIMLKTYTYGGLEYVQSFWNNMSTYKVLPDHAIYKQYLVAHAYHGDIEGAMARAAEIGDHNLEFLSDMLLAMHNFCPTQAAQKQLAEWAQTEHAGLWDEVQAQLVEASPYDETKLLDSSGTSAVAKFVE